MAANILFQEEAWENLTYWALHDRKIFKRIQDLLRDIGRGGYEGIGKPEPLKGDLSGVWSRRIDKYNRLIYRIEGETIEILSCKGHYDE